MINDFQRRILAEAAKFGGVFASNSQKIAKELNEAPALGSDTATTMFGYSKPQFEAKIRQLLQKMGFEKGITRMMTKPNGNMVLYFANKAKARDFAMTFEGMTRRMSGGSNIVQFTTGADMTPDQKKFATGAEAMVELMLNKLKKESLDNESYIFMALENLHEEYVTEGGVKAALEDFMYSLPKAAIAELKPLMKTKGGVAQQVMRLASITAILNKHGVVKKFMGFNTANLVNDYFDTFHGESVEEAYAHPDEKVLGRFYEKTGKQAFEYRISQDSWGKSHGYPHEVCVSRKDYKGKGDWRAANVKGTVCYIVTDEGEGGKPVVEKWTITKHVKYVRAEGFETDVEVLDEDNWGGGFETSREAQAKVQAALKADAKKRQALILSALQQVIDGKMSKPAFKKLTGSSFNDIMKLPFYSKKVKMKKEEVVEDGEIEEAWEMSDQTITEKTKLTPDQLKQVNQSVKAKIIAKKQGKKEEVEEEEIIEDGEIEEAKEKYLTGPGKKDPKRIIGIYTMKGKWIKDMNSEKEAANFVNKSWGESVEEEIEVSEQFKAGDKVKVPHKGKMVSGKIVRFDGGGTSKAQQHGGGYVVDVGEPASITVPKQKVQKEEVEVSEAVNIGTNAYHIQRSGSNWEVWRLSYSQGSVRFADGRKGTKLRGDFKSYNDALLYATKDAGVKEETEVTEAMNNYLAFYNGKKMTVRAETSYKAQLKAIEMFKVPASKKHMVTVKLADNKAALANNEEVEVNETALPTKAEFDQISKELATKKLKRAATQQAVVQGGTKLIAHVGKITLMRMAIKTLGKETTRFLLKKIPVVGLALGTIFAANRLAKGEYVKAAVELVGGVASTIPVWGTAVALACDGFLVTGDVYKIKQMNDDFKKVEAGSMSDEEFAKKWKLEKLKNESFNHPKQKEFESAIDELLAEIKTAEENGLVEYYEEEADGEERLVEGDELIRLKRSML